MVAADTFIQQDDGNFALHGDMTFKEVHLLVKNSSVWSASGNDTVTIDMVGVKRADSAGLALMLEWMKQAREAGISIRYTNIPDQLSRLIRVSGLSDVLS